MEMEHRGCQKLASRVGECHLSGDTGEAHDLAPFMCWVPVARKKWKTCLASAPFDHLFSQSRLFFLVDELAENLREMKLWFWSATGRTQTRKGTFDSWYSVLCAFSHCLAGKNNVLGRPHSRFRSHWLENILKRSWPVG